MCLVARPQVQDFVKLTPTFPYATYLASIMTIQSQWIPPQTPKGPRPRAQCAEAPAVSNWAPAPVASRISGPYNFMVSVLHRSLGRAGVPSSKRTLLWEITMLNMSIIYSFLLADNTWQCQIQIVESRVSFFSAWSNLEICLKHINTHKKWTKSDGSRLHNKFRRRPRKTCT